MIKKFIIPAIIGIIIGLISGFNDYDVIVRIIFTTASLILDILLLLGPIIIFITLSIGIMEIKKDYFFFIKLLTFIFISLFILGIIIYAIISIIYPFIIQNTIGEFGNSIRSYFKIPIKTSFLLPYSLFFGILFGFLLQLNFKYKNKIKSGFKLSEKILFKLITTILLPVMPILIIATFARSAYDSTQNQIIINDLILSIVILLFQFSFLFIMYFIASKYCNIPLRKILYSAKTLYFKVVSLMGLGSNICLPYSIEAQSNVGIPTSYAKIISASSFNLPGSFIANICFSYGIIVMFNMNITTPQYLLYIIMLIIATIIAPAIPLGVFSVTSSLLIPFLGFGDVQLNLMSTMYYNQGISNASTNNSADIYLGLLLTKEKK